MARLLTEVCQPRLRLVTEYDPSGIASNGDHSSAADFGHRVANAAKTVMIERTIVVTDPLARANVMEALAGSGAPAGMLRCVVADSTIELAFDGERTAPELIDAIVAIAQAFVPMRQAAIADLDVAVKLAAAGLNEPDLDRSRILESYLA